MKPKIKRMKPTRRWAAIYANGKPLSVRKDRGDLVWWNLRIARVLVTEIVRKRKK